MPGRLRDACRSILRRARRFERREVREFRDWIEHTDHLIHLSILFVMPFAIGLVTWVSNVLDAYLPFLLFPPLASGGYTLFAHPESKYASPRRFVGGLTAGALCGWLALEVSALYLYEVAPEALNVHPGAAALAIFLTGAVTWALDVEESSAFSTSLLVLVTGAAQLLYVVSIAVATTVVAAVFLVWREYFYEQRAEFLYQTTRGDDHVLVPMRGENPHPTAMLAANLAAAHEAGKVVLLDIVDDEDVAAAERDLLEDEPGRADLVTDGGDPGDDGSATRSDEAEELAVAATTTRLENRARTIEDEFDVPCEVIVAVGGGDPASTTVEAVEAANCDLIAVSYEADGNGDGLSGFVRGLLAGDVDVILHRSIGERTEWHNALVTVRRAGDLAHAMIDFALRLVPTGEVSVCHCIDAEDERRRAEEMLANLVETFTGSVETRVTKSSIEAFLERNDDRYDVVFLGASTDRSAASRFLSKPTFQRVGDIDTDVAIVHRG